MPKTSNTPVGGRGAAGTLSKNQLPQHKAQPADKQDAGRPLVTREGLEELIAILDASVARRRMERRV
jgi:hypothetical protein